MLNCIKHKIREKVTCICVQWVRAFQLKNNIKHKGSLEYPGK